MDGNEIIKNDVKPCYDSEGIEGKFRDNANLRNINGKRLGKKFYCTRFSPTVKSGFFECPRLGDVAKLPDLSGGTNYRKIYLCGSKEDNSWEEEK